MSVSSVTSVKQALGTALATISGLRAYDHQPDQVNPPMGWPILDQIEYHGAMGPGLVTHEYRVMIVVGRASERAAQQKLDSYLSYDSGVRAALEADQTLGGVAQSLIVQSASKISTIDANDGTYLVVEFRVLVYT